ncbi:uncharacterized protein LOC131638810 [Vicia villosa]|uniref:uncharacterized protein LOC131638810 n=1 Tax=Vicia villosa TaxID=3911 RepID=UPI00273C7C05|nr:uncharacterized protein LOC131638810 [Vicia villosa]
MKTVSNLPKCYERLVKEFVVNLFEDYGNSKSVDFRKVFVRAKCVSFSPSVINNSLERTNEAQPELEVTNNKVFQVITAKKVKRWPLKKKLTARTKAKFDYGIYIFDQTMKHAKSFSVKGPIALPSLLFGIILNQYPNILNEHDIACKRESPLPFNYKLFQDMYVPNIVMTSDETSKSGASDSKAEVKAMLKETCKELESRNISLEKLISTLEKDGNEELADAIEMEAEDEKEEEVEPEEVEEESVSPADGSEKGSYADTSSGSDSVSCSRYDLVVYILMVVMVYVVCAVVLAKNFPKEEIIDVFELAAFCGDICVKLIQEDTDL